MRRLNQALHILKRAVVGFDCIIVGHIVTVIAMRFSRRHQPNAGDAEIISGFGIAIVEVVKSVDDTLQVTDTIAIAIAKAADENLVKHAVVPPIWRQRVRALVWGLRGGSSTQKQQQHGDTGEFSECLPGMLTVLTTQGLAARCGYHWVILCWDQT